ncbi:hypothetical protein CRG98_019633 [Punica granatum]|uniref:DUF7745 domain-containing protein n=1 Tax=Punica granatum TaxID=22663 RepID=A0A2I0JWV9_PUNGR|nr:hypothetical protein CRG98_019633 [Punica granatum]
MFTETPVDWIFLRTAAEFWDPEHVVFNFQGTELAPTIEEYTTLIQRPIPTTHDIFMPNPFTTVQGQLSTLLHILAQDIHEELHQRWDQGIRIAWLSDWTLLRRMTPTTASYQRDACHGFLLLVFGTLLFPYSPNLVDGAIAQVILQAMGGHSYGGSARQDEGIPAPTSNLASRPYPPLLLNTSVLLHHRQAFADRALGTSYPTS